MIRHGKQVIKDDQMVGIKNTWMAICSINHQLKEKLHQKRDNTGSMDIKAIQATINDHRTMISNIISNSISPSTIQQAVCNHYSSSVPVWNSWRDIALIFLLFVVIVQIFYCCICQVKLRPWDYLVSCIFRCHNTRQLQKEREERRPFSRPSFIINTTNMGDPMKPKSRFTLSKFPVSAIEADYAEYHHSDS